MKHGKRRKRHRPDQREAVSAVPSASAKPPALSADRSVPGWEVGQMETAVIVTGSEGQRSLIYIVDSDGDDAGMLITAANDVVVRRRSSGRIDIIFGREFIRSVTKTVMVRKGSIREKREREIEDAVRKDVVKTLRIKEKEKAQQKISLGNDWNYLCSAGVLNGWCYSESESISSETTKLTTDEIIGVLRLALNPNGFEPERSNCCHQGICQNREHDQCSYYRFGFLRCDAIRKTVEATAKKPEAPEAEEEIEGIFFEDGRVNQLGFATENRE